jgi:hypothetical protein
MSKVISLRHSSQFVLAALCGLLLFAASARAEERTWNLASEFGSLAKNPAPDKYGHKAVWYYSVGRPDRLKYPNLKYFFGAPAVEAACGIKEVYEWDQHAQVEGAPAVWYNAGPTVEEGQDQCAPYVTLPTKTVFMHPKIGTPGSSVVYDAVVRWKSYKTGTVTVSGSVQLVDSYPAKGISWGLDRGETRLVGPTESSETNLMSFGPMTVSVVSGEYLNLEVGREPAVFGYYDSTAVSLTITSP